MLLIIVLAVLVIAAAAAYYVYQQQQQQQQQQQKSLPAGAGGPTETREGRNVGDDASYIASRLGPESSHTDVLLCIATTPENIYLSEQQLSKVEAMRAEKIAKQEENKKKNASKSSAAAFDLDEAGWAEDEEEDEAAKKAREEEESREQAKKELNAATGKTNMPMEGIDEGVVGQKWVENTLAQKGYWPPKDLGLIKDLKFKHQGKMVSPLDHPAIRRNLCMTMGRLHSIVLNTHTELCKFARIPCV